jgi:hypothetical protein
MRNLTRSAFKSCSKLWTLAEGIFEVTSGGEVRMRWNEQWTRCVPVLFKLCGAHCGPPSLQVPSLFQRKAWAQWCSKGTIVTQAKWRKNNTYRVQNIDNIYVVATQTNELHTTWISDLFIPSFHIPFSSRLPVLPSRINLLVTYPWLLLGAGVGQRISSQRHGLLIQHF